jgi:hypothetical protein
MKLSFAPTLAVTLSLLLASNAQAVVITAEAAGVTNTSVTGVTTIDFNDLTCGAYGSCTGDYTIFEDNSDSGGSAQPAGTSGSDSPYLSVPNPERFGSANFNLWTTANFFGLYWGSMDESNTVTFLLHGVEVASFTGADIEDNFNGEVLANRSQTSDASNRYINFDFGDQLFSTVQLSNRGYAFETDNHSFVKVPEPGTLALLALGLTGLLVARRRKQV